MAELRYSDDAKRFVRVVDRGSGVAQLEFDAETQTRLKLLVVGRDAHRGGSPARLVLEKAAERVGLELVSVMKNSLVASFMMPGVDGADDYYLPAVAVNETIVLSQPLKVDLTQVGDAHADTLVVRHVPKRQRHERGGGNFGARTEATLPAAVVGSAGGRRNAPAPLSRAQLDALSKPALVEKVLELQHELGAWQQR